MSELLRISELKVAYGNKTVVDGVDLNLESGQLCGILGLNGSGKTTVLNAIDGLLEYSGEITCCQKDVRRLNEYERSKIVSYIHQRTMLKDGISSVEFVLYGINPYLKFYETPNDCQKQRAKEILCELGLCEKINSDFGTLSEGEKQLVILARSIMQNAPVMLMDEPDSSLDYNNKHLLFSTVRKTVREYGFGGLVSLHNPDFALRYCDKICVLHGGKKVREIYKSTTSKEEIEEALSLLYKGIKIIEYNGEYLTAVDNEN